jgi:hypothetical protein
MVVFISFNFVISCISLFETIKLFSGEIDSEIDKHISSLCWSLFHKCDGEPFLILPDEETKSSLILNEGPMEEYIWLHKKQEGVIKMPSHRISNSEG